MRVPQQAGRKGSLKWMQQLVGTGTLDPAFHRELALKPDETITWLSPVSHDDHAEYRDRMFLDRIGHPELQDALRDFWPARGPQWDGLAVTSSGAVILIEAKAHVNEMVSSCAARAASLELINEALGQAKRHYSAPEDADWTTGFYQYANRLAHLMFLREHEVDAHLVFVYFVHDPDMGRTTLADWANATDECYDHLGLAKAEAIPGVHSLYVNVASGTYADDQGRQTAG